MVFAPYFIMAGFVVVVFREQLVRRAARLGASLRARLEAVPARFARLRDPA